MLRILCVCYLALFTSFSGQGPIEKPILKPMETEGEGAVTQVSEWYENLGLEPLLPFEAFELALAGYERIADKRKELLTIIDFTKPSTEERMFVLDMKNRRILFQTIVAHGRNSGEMYARKFSNTHGSFQSSLGFYLTGGTYMGGNGYSLRLDGLEEGINDQARSRAVVIHGADYCSEDFIRRNGRLGRSYGCPALPRAVNDAIIDTIKDGSLLFIYADDTQYASNSPILKSEAASEETASWTPPRYL